MQKSRQVHMFRRGVIVWASLIVGAQVGLFGVWLLRPFTTFDVSLTYSLMAKLAPEWAWGWMFAIPGWTLFLTGLTLWLKLWVSRPVPLWLRGLTALLITLKLVVVVAIFYVATNGRGTGAPLFAVLLASSFMLLVSALDEAEFYERWERWRARFFLSLERWRD